MIRRNPSTPRRLHLALLTFDPELNALLADLDGALKAARNLRVRSALALGQALEESTGVPMNSLRGVT